MNNDLKAFYSLLNRISEKEEVDALLLLGGLGKQKYCHKIDKYSDYDICIFLSGEIVPLWLPNFSFRLYLGDGVVGRTVNVYQMFTCDILKPNCKWNPAKCEAYEEAKFFYERDGRIRSRIIEIIRNSYSKQDELINNIHKLNRFINNDEKLLYRNSPISLTIMYDKCIEMIIASVFLLNNRHVPHVKWYENDLKMLTWLPTDFWKLLIEFFDLHGMESNIFIRKKELLVYLQKSLIQRCELLKINVSDYRYINTVINQDRQLLCNTCADYYLQETVDIQNDEVYRSYINTFLISRNEIEDSRLII